MPCLIHVRTEPAFVEAVYQGTLAPADLAVAAEDLVATARAHKTNRILADCLALEGGHGIVDLYGLIDWLAANHADLRIREAIILPAQPGLNEQVRFWETACHNRGVEVCVFPDRPSALAWLLR